MYFECRVSLLLCLLNSCKPTRFIVWVSEGAFLKLCSLLDTVITLLPNVSLQYKHTFILQHTNQVSWYKIYYYFLLLRHMTYRNTEVQKCSFLHMRFKTPFWQRWATSLLAYNIQLLAIFFFCTSSTSNLYLAIHSSWKKTQKCYSKVGILVLL